ncbi:MAG: hypothetical protein KJ970_13430 [Candidatus Eisenbacteria bacterium]|uniref:Uncharacterized protein n=1 Tax=Eiseniibacteriota bacterium TaxID=2212470 RepID=A0A948W7R3_UNCEI|nr:hypothetical protein [Candidatus Eisenbacteria bacterium]MBU1947918.1 hypothetical protein [Candidatus Eisenbacteria bacterium]MBU2691916.1 hypothetical protein [Candidatus Eisenbacteria bacterium]
MLEAFSTPHNRTLTFVFLAICCASVVAAGVVGISDNLPGILLAFGGAAALILAFVHPWRTARQFRLLLLVSVISFVVLAVLHNVFEAVAGMTEIVGAIKILLQGLSIAAFLLAVLVCPPAIMVSAVGSIVMAPRNHRPPAPDRSSDA